MALPSPIRLTLLGVVPVAVLVGLWVIAATRPTETPGEAVELSGPMPALAGDAVVGRGEITPDVYEGKVVVVNFWASWCVPCRTEQPGLERLWKQYRTRGVQFLGVNFNDDAAAAREFVREFRVTYPSVRDPSGQIAADFAIPYVPTTVIADAEGQLRWMLPGEQHPDRLREYVEAVLAAS